MSRSIQLTHNASDHQLDERKIKQGSLRISKNLFSSKLLEMEKKVSNLVEAQKNILQKFEK